MNERQTAILEQLLTGQTMTTKSLSQTNHVSERTIRNDLTKITTSLTEAGYPFELAKKPGVGIQFHSPVVAKITQAFLQSTQVYEGDYRRKLLLFRLLMASEATTLSDLAAELFVNKQIIRDDLAWANQQLAPENLTVTVKPKIGVFVTGSEGHKRDLLARLLKDLTTTQKNGDFLSNFFSPRDLQITTQLVANFEERYQLPNRGQPDNSIVIHLLFMITRIKNKGTITLSQEEWQLIQYSKAYHYAQELTEQLTEKIGLRFPADEIGYLALRIASFYSANAATDDPYSQQVSQQVTEIITDLIANVQQTMGYDLSGDPILKDNLRLHLNATFTRITSGFHIANPLKAEILKNYTQLFLIVQSITEEFAEDKNWQIPEEEIAYLTVHLQGAIERLKEQKSLGYRTVIICNFGIGVSAFIEAKLTRLFPDVEVIGLLSLAEVPAFDFQQVDFVLTTVDLPALTPPTLTISPLFEKVDQNKIAHFLQQNQTQGDLKTIDINQFTNPFLVQVHLTAKNQQEVLASMCQNLQKKGYIRPDYFESVLKREAKSSTHVGSLIALPHGDPAGIKHSFIAIATLPQPLSWGHAHVQLVILLGLQKDLLGNQETKKLFSLIHYLVETPTALKDVLQATEPLEVLHKLSDYR